MIQLWWSWIHRSHSHTYCWTLKKTVDWFEVRLRVWTANSFLPEPICILCYLIQQSTDDQSIKHRDRHFGCTIILFLKYRQALCGVAGPSSANYSVPWWMSAAQSTLGECKWVTLCDDGFSIGPEGDTIGIGQCQCLTVRQVVRLTSRKSSWTLCLWINISKTIETSKYVEFLTVIPFGPTWNPWDCALLAAAPNPPRGPWVWKAWAPAFAADAPKPLGPKFWLWAFALARALEDP